MSPTNPPGYDEVLAASNRVLDQFALAFEKWWLRRDVPTREKYLAEALQKSGAFGPGDAERVRTLTRDPVPICHLLETIHDARGTAAVRWTCRRYWSGSCVEGRAR